MARPKRIISNPDPSDRPAQRQNTGESLESGEIPPTASTNAAGEIPPTTSTTIAGGRETQFSDDLNNTPKHKDLEDSAFSPNREGDMTKQPVESEISAGSVLISALEEQRLKMEADMKKLHDSYMQSLAEIQKKKEEALRAEEERIRREEEERKRKEEEERIRAEEERKRKEEEERVRAEAEERKRQEEEARKKQEEDERKKREEDERKRKAEADLKVREEKEARKRDAKKKAVEKEPSEAMKNAKAVLERAAAEKMLWKRLDRNEDAEDAEVSIQYEENPLK